MDYENEMKALNALMNQEEDKAIGGIQDYGNSLKRGYDYGRPRLQGAASVMMGYKPQDNTEAAMKAFSGADELAVKNALERRKSMLNRYQDIEKLKAQEELFGKKQLIDKAKEEQEQKNWQSNYDLKEKELALKSKEQGSKPIAPAQIININEGNTIPNTLNKIEELIENNKDMFSPLTGRLRTINPYDEKAQILDAEMRASSQQFGRYMEGGVLRKEDEEKYRKMFPKISDTEAVAKGKLEVVRSMMERKQASDIEALKKQGYNVSGLELPQREAPLSKPIQSVSKGGLIREAGAAEPTVKKVNGVTYRKVPGGWVEVE